MAHAHAHCWAWIGVQRLCGRSKLATTAACLNQGATSVAAGNTGCTISRQPAQVDRAANRTGTAKARWSFRHGPFWQPYQPGLACCCVHFHGSWQLGLPALIPRPPRRVMPAKLAGGQVDSQQQQPKRGSHRPAQARHPSTCLWRRLSTNLPLRQTAHRTGRCTLCTPQCTSGKPAKQERLVDRRATWRPLHRSTCYPRRCAPHFRRLRPAQDLPQGLLLRVCGHPLQDRARALRQGPPQPRAPEAPWLRQPWRPQVSGSRAAAAEAA